MGSLYRAQRFLTPESILYLYKSTIRPCMEYCSHIWGDAPRSHGIDLLDRVQKLVISLAGSELSSDLQVLSHRRDVASLILFYKYYYGECSFELVDLYLPNVSLLETLAFLSRCIVIHLILLCAGLSFINQAFCLAGITISQHRGLASFCY